MPEPPGVVVTHWVHDPVLASLARFSSPSCPPRATGVWPAAEVARRAAGAQGLMVCMADRVDGALLDACPRLRVVAATLKGHDNIDVAACARRGVHVAITSDEAIIGPTAELAVGLAIGILRRVGEADRAVRADGFHGWRPWWYGAGLAGARVGIVGMGALGQAIARRLAAFEPATIAYHDPRPLPATAAAGLGVVRAALDEVLAGSDLTVLATPLTASTVGLVSAARLAAVPPGACLVNVGRGSVVDEEAVADALHDGRLGGYAADVWAVEDRSVPGRPGHVSERLLAHPRTLVTPHLGSAVDGVRQVMSLRSVAQVRQVLVDGVPPDGAVRPG